MIGAEVEVVRHGKRIATERDGLECNRMIRGCFSLQHWHVDRCCQIPHRCEVCGIGAHCDELVVRLEHNGPGESVLSEAGDEFTLIAESSVEAAVRVIAGESE